DNQLDALIVGDSPSLADNPAQDPLQPQGPRRRTPCSGPGCSSSRVPVPVPATSQGPDSSDQWAALGALRLLPILFPPSRTTDEPAARPVGQGPSIFHPPPA